MPLWRYRRLLSQHLSANARCQQVKGYNGKEELDACLKGAELVIIPAGVPRKPGMTRDDLFNTNAGIVKDLIEAIARNCPGVRAVAMHPPLNGLMLPHSAHPPGLLTIAGRD